MRLLEAPRFTPTNSWSCCRIRTLAAPYQSGDVATLVRDLQAQPDGGIWIVGGGWVKALLEADLIDEWWVQVVPVLLGMASACLNQGTMRRG